MLCELCGVEDAYNEHHLIPRHCHRKKWWQKNFSRQQMRQTVMLCKTCHNSIHRLEPSEKVLGRYHNTLETLAQHPAIARYLEWKTRRLRVAD